LSRVAIKTLDVVELDPQFWLGWMRQGLLHA